MISALISWSHSCTHSKLFIIPNDLNYINISHKVLTVIAFDALLASV